MAILVTFMRPDGLNGHLIANVGSSRAYEDLTLSSGVTTTAVAADGEVALVVSTEAETIRAARGSSPDAATASATTSSDAAFPVPPNVPIPVQLRAGDKLNFKPLA